MREPRNYEAPLCAQVNGDIWFPEKGADNLVVEAKRVCFSCDHRLECAEWGIQNEKHGIWGGLSAEERRIIRARRKIVLPKERSA